MSTDTTASMRQDWAGRLERDGYVESGMSWRRLARAMAPGLALVPVGIAVLAIWSEHKWGFVGGFTLAALGGWGALDQLPRPSRWPALRVDRDGLSVWRRRPVRIGWADVLSIDGMKRSLWIEVNPATLDRPEDRRWARSSIDELDHAITLELLDALIAELAAWLDAEVNQQVPLESVRWC